MGPEIELRLCRAFVAVVDYGGPTRAAPMLGVAQSTVSEAILTLERAIGSPVFSRQQKGARRELTAVGEALLPHARALIESANTAMSAARRAAKEARSPSEQPENRCAGVRDYVPPSGDLECNLSSVAACGNTSDRRSLR